MCVCLNFGKSSVKNVSNGTLNRHIIQQHPTASLRCHGLGRTCWGRHSFNRLTPLGSGVAVRGAVQVGKLSHTRQTTVQ